MKKRAGGRTHLSISLPTDQAELLKRRANRMYGGDISRVVSDALRYLAYEEGCDALIASLAQEGKPSAPKQGSSTRFGVWPAKPA